MRKLIAKDLKIKFIETLNELDEFSYEEGNPFLIKIGTAKYFVFLKNLSSAYFKNPDITRVQLPYSDHFSKIFKADIPFIILGYDVDNDIVVSWNPKNVKERLNAKSNVSLYSRFSLQGQVKDDEFQFGYLTNREKIVLFKRENLIAFFDVALDLFKETDETNAIPLNSITKRKEPLSDKQRFILWLQEKYAESSVRVYTYGVEKISKDLEEISKLKKKSLFDIQNPEKLKELYTKWYAVREFKEKDLIAKYQNSNSFKRYIDFREYEQTLNPKTTKTAQKQVEIEQNTNTISEITDKELLQTIKPLLKKNQVLQAVEITSKHLGKQYKNMTFKDWYKIVSELYRKMN